MNDSIVKQVFASLLVILFIILGFFLLIENGKAAEKEQEYNQWDIVKQFEYKDISGHVYIWGIKTLNHYVGTKNMGVIEGTGFVEFGKKPLFIQDGLMLSIDDFKLMRKVLEWYYGHKILDIDDSIIIDNSTGRPIIRPR